MKKSILGIHKPFYKFCLVSADIVVIAVAFSIAANLRLNVSPNFLSIEYITLCSIVIICMFLGNGYTDKLLGSKPRLPMNTFFVVVSSSLPCSVFIYLMGPDRFTILFGRGVFPVALFLSGLFAVLNRVILNRIFDKQGATKKILILGNQETHTLIQSFFINRLFKLEIDYQDQITKKSITSDHHAIVVAPEYVANDSEQRRLLDIRLKGTPVFSFSDFVENFLFLIPVNRVSNEWFVRSEGFTMLHSTVTIKLKRFLDIFSSILLLIFSAPVLLLSMLAIKLSSKGPVIFKQTRVGCEGYEFTIYKLRTMHVDAEIDGARWASEDDERIFPIGKFLRKSRIDEIPQCWNIVKGEMSFVGPRPERPEFTNELAAQIPYYDLRHIVKPGLTGWAQVNYPYGASVDDALRKLQFDLYYIKNYSVLLDLNIILRTAKVMLTRSGR